ncbi:HD domain-containing protein [Oscillospiraceae bacterium OttesenSCG-928-F05]|nr:HD domain-containing protein [Oscillospiraceae bacterium OttesenSCG-928-F05]
MLLRAFNLALNLAGCAILILATVRFHRSLWTIRRESYAAQVLPRSPAAGLALMYLFIIGFIVGFFDLLFRDVEPIYTFILVIFFFGAIYIYASVHTHCVIVQSMRDRVFEVMCAFAGIVDEKKDSRLRNHSPQVRHTVAAFWTVLPEKVRAHLNYAKLLDAAILHDVGLINIPDGLLSKKGPLDDDEWALIRKHPALGRDLLENSHFREIGHWLFCHHERMDGAGYYQVPGEEIPLESKIIAVADTYTALRENRAYREPLSHGEAQRILWEVAGTQLDAELVAYFLRLEKDALDFSPDTLPA